jgi:hypothetical protein
MRLMRVAALAIPVALLAQAGWAADKYVWDGNGGGQGAKCSAYVFHMEVVIDNGHAVGWWQQKGRDLRKFDLPVKGDGTFEGEVPISNGNIVYVKGKAGDPPTIETDGYCSWGGPMKKG